MPAKPETAARIAAVPWTICPGLGRNTDCSSYSSSTPSTSPALSAAVNRRPRSSGVCADMAILHWQSLRGTQGARHPACDVRRLLHRLLHTCKLDFHPLIELRNVDHDALVRPVADRLALVP